MPNTLNIMLRAMRRHHSAKIKSNTGTWDWAIYCWDHCKGVSPYVEHENAYEVGVSATIELPDGCEYKKPNYNGASFDKICRIGYNCKDGNADICYIQTTEKDDFSVFPDMPKEQIVSEMRSLIADGLYLSMPDINERIVVKLNVLDTSEKYLDRDSVWK